MTANTPRFGSGDPESRYIHWQIARQDALAELTKAQREADPDPSVLWFSPADGKVYDRPENGEEVYLRPAAINGEQILYEVVDKPETDGPRPGGNTP